jgi:hypothetical protein
MLANYRIVNGALDYVHETFKFKERQVLNYQPPTIPSTFKDYATMENFKVEGLTGGLSPAQVAEVYIDFLTKARLDPWTEFTNVRDPIIQRAIKNRLICQQSFGHGSEGGRGAPRQGEPGP